MNHAIARLETAKASGYLQQLCKHFAHRLPVQFTAEHGRIPFQAGTCELEAGDGALTMRVAAADAGHLAELQDVVARHLLRFAFREQVALEWQPLDIAG
jgi:hypothetical protein